MIDLIKNKLENDIGLNVLAIIPYGSQVYKNKVASDFDFYIIVEEDNVEQDIHKDDIDLSIISKNKFLNECNNNTVKSIESLYTDPKTENYYVDKDFGITLQLLKKTVINKSKMRENFSKTTSNSYVKAKKKIIVEEDFDYMTSLKSLWHSIRINDFAIQILEKEKIDFTSMNNLYTEIENDYKKYNVDNKEDMWKNIHSKYKPIFNQKSSMLKKICPKKNNSLKNS